MVLNGKTGQEKSRNPGEAALPRRQEKKIHLGALECLQECKKWKKDGLVPGWQSRTPKRGLGRERGGGSVLSDRYYLRRRKPNDQRGEKSQTEEGEILPPDRNKWAKPETPFLCPGGRQRNLMNKEKRKRRKHL